VKYEPVTRAHAQLLDTQYDQHNRKVVAQPKRSDDNAQPLHGYLKGVGQLMLGSWIVVGVLGLSVG
jgi:hypothetical protein